MSDALLAFFILHPGVLVFLAAAVLFVALWIALAALDVLAAFIKYKE